VQHLRSIAQTAAQANVQKQIANKNYVPSEYVHIRRIGQSAKERCHNKANAHYKNYGARGIQFCFSSATAFAWWVIDNIGDRPNKNYSIDRIDNNRHYEPGNLRWATKEEQNRNKRAYCGNQYGYRLKKLLMLRPDYTYEGLRKYIKKGLTDDEIINIKKPCGGRPRKNSSPRL